MRTLLILAALSAACGQPLQAPPLAHLDRPVDIAFGCAADVADSTGAVTTVGLPNSACAGAAAVAPDAGTAGSPDGGVGPLRTRYPLAFVIEAARGDVSVTLQGNSAFVDNDVFAPGLNGIPVGRLPVGIVTTSNGCSTVVANNGSCDLALVNVGNAFRARPGSVRRQVMSSSAGALAARPTAIVAPPSLPFDGTAPSCDPSAPEGVVYVSFASCGLVARVELPSGRILDGVQFHPGTAPTLVGPDVTCPIECTDVAGAAGAPSGAGAGAAASPQPVALDIDPAGDRLYVGTQDTPNLAIVGLDAAGAPTKVDTLALEGAGGIVKLAATGDTAMGQEGSTGIFRFVYAIGQDQAIHVANVTPGDPPVECDTQIDRRYLHNFNDVSLLACFPVGRTSNPPRRAASAGPGIRLPSGVLPLDLNFIQGAQSVPIGKQPDPSLLNGTFAVVSAIGPVADATIGRGLAYFINVNDSNYPQLQANFPSQWYDIALAIPHSLRDGNATRIIGELNCVDPGYAGNIGPVRMDVDPVRLTGYIYNDTGSFGDTFAPSLHRVFCASNIPAWSLGVLAPPDVRAQMFPDLGTAGLRSADVTSAGDEQIVVTWEGPLTGQVADSRRTGGQLETGDQQITLHAPGALICALGVETGDIVALLGCTSDTDCGLGERCIIHPDSPSGTSGMCLPAIDVTRLLGDCRETMIASRRYSAIEVGDDHVVIVPRKDVLYATPLDGCTDDAQCNAIEDWLVAQAQAGAAPGTPIIRHTYTCDVDGPRGGPKRCITTCAADVDCTAGSVCDTAIGQCILGAVPPPQCLAPLQRYEILAGDAFSIISSNGEYKGRQKVDPKSGLCVEDTSLGPLVINRFHRIEPTCTDLSTSAVTPNPCFIPDLQEPTNDSGGFAMRPAYGIRVRSPGITFDMTDVAVPYPDAANQPGRLFTPVNQSYTMAMRIGGGFIPMALSLNEALPSRARLAPNNVLWIVDSGDYPNGLTTGQVVQIVGATIGDIKLL
jgi:hypothetical protein